MRIQSKNRKNAFSLIEILIVVVIIAGLAAITLPILQQSRLKSLGARCSDQMRVIQESKHMLTLDTPNADPTAALTSAQCAAYLEGGVFPNEPVTGTTAAYTVGAPNDLVSCSQNDSTVDPDRGLFGAGNKATNGYHDLGR